MLEPIGAGLLAYIFLDEVPPGVTLVGRCADPRGRASWRSEPRRATRRRRSGSVAAEMEHQRFVTVDDFEPVARERLEPALYDYFAGGAGDEITLAENRRAFDRWVLRPSVPPGARQDRPLDLGARAPSSRSRSSWRRGPTSGWSTPTARRGRDGPRRRRGTVMVVSSTAFDVAAEVAGAAPGPAWWQLYLAEDRGFAAEMLARVDAGRLRRDRLDRRLPGQSGLRHRDTRSGFVMPFGLPGVGLRVRPRDLVGRPRRGSASTPRSAGLGEGDPDRRGRAARGRARRGRVIVSNHGGRQLDRRRRSLDALPEIVEAVAGAMPGRRGRRGAPRHRRDKALALGAAAVMVARPAAWGLAVGGEAGRRAASSRSCATSSRTRWRSRVRPGRGHRPRPGRPLAAAR